MTAPAELFCAWDPVLRSVLDGRRLYRPGAVCAAAADGADLDLDQRFRLDERDEAARFLAEAGFLLLQGVFTEAEMDALDADLAAAVDGARPDDGASWWAATRDGERYPCRILDLADRPSTSGRCSTIPGSSRSAGSSTTATRRAIPSASTSAR